MRHDEDRGVGRVVCGALQRREGLTLLLRLNCFAHASGAIYLLLFGHSFLALPGLVKDDGSPVLEAARHCWDSRVGDRLWGAADASADKTIDKRGTANFERQNATHFTNLKLHKRNHPPKGPASKDSGGTFLNEKPLAIKNSNKFALPELVPQRLSLRPCKDCIEESGLDAVSVAWLEGSACACNQVVPLRGRGRQFTSF